MSDSADKTHRRWPRRARITAGIAAALLLLILAGYTIAPPIAKNILEKQLTKNLSTPQVTRTAHIDRIRISPLALSCAIENLTISADDRAPLVHWRNLYASLDLRTLFTHEWRFRKIALDGLDGRIAILKDGNLNFSDLARPTTEIPTPTPPSSPPKKSAPLRIGELAITDARIDYSDDSLPRPFATQLGPINITLRDFQTGGPDRAPGEFNATTESGETLAWRGTLSVAPLNSAGEIRIGNLSAKKYTPFYAHRVRFEILEGKIDITLHYEIANDNNTLAARATQSLITLHDLKLAERNQTAPAIAIETLELSGITAVTQTDQHAIHIDRIALDNATIALRHDAQGLSLAQLLTPVSPDSAAAQTANRKLETVNSAPDAEAAAPRPQVTVAELHARNITLDLEDTTLETTLRTQTTITDLDAKNFSLEKIDTPIPLELAARLPDNGQLHATGTLALSPLRGTINAELTDAPLTLARAHANQYLNAHIDNGRATAKATITLDPSNGMKIAGDAAITDFAATMNDTPLQNWKQLALRNITYATAPSPALTIDEINLDGAATQLALQADGKLNLAALVKPSATTATTTTTSTAATPTKIAIGKVTLTDNTIAFTDHTITPAINLTLNDLNGTISNLSSENLAHADVSLHAKINDTAPVALTGQINPLSNDVYSDLHFTIDNATLAPVGPYIGKYAGRTLANGTLNVDITTKVSQRFLDSTNVITLNQFALGENTNSPDATSLPIGLAVALLRDRNGKIVLDVPVKGSLDDPDFKYGRAVWRAIGNLLVKAATAPFTLLTSLLGAGGGSTVAGNAASQPDASAPAQDLSTAEFSPGATDPSPETQRKLQLLAQALRERPALQLAIKGGYDTANDRTALRNALLIKQLKQEYWADLGGQRGTQAATASEQIEVPPDTEPRLVERLYQRKFLVEERTVQNATTDTTAPRLAASVLPPGTASRIEKETATLGGKTSSGSRSITAKTTTATTIAKPNLSGEPAPQTAVAKTAPPLPTHDEMRTRLLDTIQVNDDQLRLLASVRAEAVKNYLVNEGIDANRITLADTSANGALTSLELR